MTTSTIVLQTPQRSSVESHLFSVGQAVRLKGRLWGSGNVYLVTAKLPPIGDSPQYRIRSDAEKFERVATQSNLELVGASDGGEPTLLEKSFSTRPTADHPRSEEAGEQRGPVDSHRL
jgi:hypothetical protein